MNTRGPREKLATVVSAGNDCFYCMDTHGTYAAELLRRDNVLNAEPLVDSLKNGTVDRLDKKMSTLATIAQRVGDAPRALTRAEVTRAKDAGASDADIQLTIFIAAAFAMYNRVVDGFRAKTPASPKAYEARALQIADYGYCDARTNSVPRLID